MPADPVGDLYDGGRLQGAGWSPVDESLVEAGREDRTGGTIPRPRKERERLASRRHLARAKLRVMEAAVYEIGTVGDRGRSGWFKGGRKGCIRERGEVEDRTGGRCRRCRTHEWFVCGR